jgi:AraC-like DNA-binding protein
LRRLTDILFIQIVRQWLETQSAETQSWLGALRDPQIGKALGLIHQAPQDAWTVATLATAVAMSRSAFAARFAQLVGEPPLQYLTRWRMSQATRLLGDQQLGLVEIANRVGYESEVTFSKAFKRQLGVAPGTWRRVQLR